MVFQIEHFKTPDLIDFPAAVFAAPAVVGLFAATQLTGSFADRFVLGDQDLRLAPVADNLLRGITLSGHDATFLMPQFLTKNWAQFRGQIRSICLRIKK